LTKRVAETMPSRKMTAEFRVLKDAAVVYKGVLLETPPGRAG
jgi:hypothetical protein